MTKTKNAKNAKKAMRLISAAVSKAAREAACGTSSETVLANLQARLDNIAKRFTDIDIKPEIGVAVDVVREQLKKLMS